MGYMKTWKTEMEWYEIKWSWVILHSLPILCSKPSLVKETTQASKSQLNPLPPHLQSSSEIADLSFSSLIHSFSVKSGLAAKTNLRTSICWSQHNREVLVKEMTTEQDHPAPAGAVSSSEPLQPVHVPGRPVMLDIQSWGTWHYDLWLNKWATNDWLKGQKKFLAMSTWHWATKACYRLPTQTRHCIV